MTTKVTIANEGHELLKIAFYNENRAFKEETVTLQPGESHTTNIWNSHLPVCWPEDPRVIHPSTEEEEVHFFAITYQGLVRTDLYDQPYSTLHASQHWRTWQARSALDQRQGFVVTDKAVAIACDAYNDAAWNTADRKGIHAVLQSIAPGKVEVPEGWKLVPIELTKDMEHVAKYAGGIHNVKKAWDAMLSAAPSQPKKEG